VFVVEVIMLNRVVKNMKHFFLKTTFKSYQKSIAFLLLTCGVGLFFTGCSTVESRIKENQIAYQQLKPDDKALVHKGKVRVGFSEEAVYLALGRASRITSKVEGNDQYKNWVYTRLVADTVPNWSYRRSVDRNGNVYYDQVFDPITTHYQVPALKVTFKGGKVYAIEEY